MHIQRDDDGGFELRHVVDAEANADALGQAQTADLRSLAETNALGQFRPLKAVDDLLAEEPAQKSAIPCLEPCALMLEFARGVFRFEQQNGAIDDMTQEDQRSLLMAAELAAEQAGEPKSEAYFAAPGNPRWMRYLRLRLGS